MVYTELNPGAVVCSLLILLCVHTVSGMSGWAGCLDGQDVFATIKENSLSGEVVAEVMADTTMEGVRWSLEGKDAHWFFLDKTDIRLNTSADKILDREVVGPILIAELSCYEEDIFQSVYRIMVEILDENDNLPLLVDSSAQTFVISELTPVNTVVFTVHATDADDDKIIYTIDQESPDAEYFKLDLPNSGEVILTKPLDYETKTQLSVTIYASNFPDEMNTAEHYYTTTNITINVLDGDDQYPQFVPCMLLFQDETSRICTSPVYTVNITEGEEDIVLDFSPGPLHAVDGDRGLNSPVSYVILSGDDDGHLSMNTETGEVRLTRGVTDRLKTPVLQLQVMAYQDNDPRKFSIATVLVRVLAVNQFNPQFNMAEYHGFVIAGKTHACLVNTYGSKALQLHVQDQDFNQGVNPKIYFTLSPTSNHTDIYQVTPEGFLIARTNRLKPKQKHVLEVMAVDQESGDTTFATLMVTVLSEGQSIPHSPLGDDRLTGCTVGKAFFLSMVFMTVLGCILSMLMWLKKRHKGKRDPLERGCVAQGKHPNVSLRWFQLVSHGSAMPHMDEVAYNTEEYGTCNPSFSFPDKPDSYTHHDLPSNSSKTPAAPDTTSTPTETVCSPVIFKNNAPIIGSVKMSPVRLLQNAAPPLENPDSPSDPTPDPADAQSNPSPSPETPDPSRASPVGRPDARTSTTNNDLVDPVTSPSSQCSVPCSSTRIASAEIDKPFSKPRVKTPPYSPSLSPPIPKRTSTPPPTPEHTLLKATLVQIDTSSADTPPETPESASVNLSTEADQPCTSLDQTDESRHTDADSPSQDRRPSTVSGNTQDGRGVGEDDDGFLGDEDADKNSEGEGEDELDPDEEELLRVLARCNPVFITFSK